MRLFSIVFLSFITLQAYARNLAKQDYWADTGLKYDVLRKMVNDLDCAKDEKKFFGCIAAVNEVLSRNPKEVPVLFVAQEHLGALEHVATVLKDYGSVKIVELEKPNPNQLVHKSVAEAAVEKKKRDEALQIWAAFFKRDSHQIAFGELLDFAKAFAVAPEHESRTTAMGINAYLSAAEDPHTRIWSDGELAAARGGHSEKFAGIGTVLTRIDGQIIVQQPMEGSPALKAGLRTKDVIIAVDGAELKDSELDDVVEKIRGTEGTTVQIKIKRGDQELDFQIQRGAIKTENVESKPLEDHAGTKFGYIRLHTFMDLNACEAVKRAVVDFEARNVKGIILDLRNNGGGDLNQSICVSGIFLEKDQVVVEQKFLHDKSPSLIARAGQVMGFWVLDDPGYHGKVTSLPMVTLVNANSASASEIVAGALQDHQRSYLVGERTFGKATVQDGLPWRSIGNHISLFMTSARFYQPSGRTNQIVGIQPDFEVYEIPNPTDDDKFEWREADLYTNALPPVGNPWVQPRPEAVHKIQECVGLAKTADGLYSARQSDAISPDYQVLAAEDVLACSLAP